MNELKPCPFCGGRAFVVEEQYFSHDYYSVACTNCFGRMASLADREKVIEAWNRRVGDIRDNAAQT